MSDYVNAWLERVRNEKLERERAIVQARESGVDIIDFCAVKAKREETEDPNDYTPCEM